MSLTRSIKQGAKATFSFFITFWMLAAFLFAAAPAITIPSELGRVETTHSGANGKTIVLIQEAHVDYNAQKAIAEILKYLIQKERLRLILVEGGWGDVNLSYLRNYGTPEARVEVAERYLKEGKISGEEYLNIASDLNMFLWGVENPDYYAENMNVFLKLNAEQDELVGEVTKLEALLDALKAKIFSPALQELESKKHQFHQNESGIIEYLLFLSGKAGAGSLDSLPHLKKLLALATSSSEFDKDKVEWEKGKLIQALSKVATKMELDRISLLKDRKSPEQEVQFLNALVEAHQIYHQKLSSLKIKNLVGYAHALEAVVTGDPGEIFKEITQLETTVIEHTSLSGDEKQLLELIHSTESLRGLFQLELGPEEFQKLDESQSFFSAVRWQGFLGGKKNEFSVALPDPNLTLLEEKIPEAKAFYQSAIKREHALIENAVQKAEQEGDLISALLVGGFHSERLRKAFEAHGFSYILISPRFTPADSADHGRKYFEILKYKWEHRTDIGLNPNLAQGG